MRIETQVARSTSKLLNEIQQISIAKAVFYRNVDRKAWQQIAEQHQRPRKVVMAL